MTTAYVAGATGLVGSSILTTLLAHPKITAVSAFTRRPLDTPPTPKLTQLESSDSTQWPSLFPSSPSSPPQIFLSALGTTRAQAGSLAAQRAIDLDLNLSLARAAKQAGVSVYVLISSNGASSASRLAYPALKGELEDAVKALGFRHCVIVRPGLILGQRSDSRPAEAVVRKVAGLVGGVFGERATDFWAQDREVIARAAVEAGVRCLEGKREEEGVWVLGQADIVRLGRTEWVGS